MKIGQVKSSKHFVFSRLLDECYCNNIKNVLFFIHKIPNTSFQEIKV